MRAISNISRWIARHLSFADRHRDSSKQSQSTPTVILTLPDGRELTMDQLTGMTGRVNFREGKLLDVSGTVQYESCLIGFHVVFALP